MKNKRIRLTITLRADYIKRIDQMVDNQLIRNRSHAIEYLVAKALEKKLPLREMFILGEERVN